ncbi:RsmB/NOP family class I SAM-dependent RNA methyltransferase [Candidatus Woesearchaeota archaeon]|nr:RsmB/NOP family class I SAM-dependent RNA methyltransferase [Candidatus Woesearchaeota archaeon]
MKLKTEFIERYKKLTNFGEYEKYLNIFLRKAIRVNTLKIDINRIKKDLDYLELKQIPWCKEGFWIESEKRDFGNLNEHKLGYIVFQESASMIPSVVLNPEKNDVVLDMSASPGAKTTHLAQIMKNKGIIVANEKHYDRIIALISNLKRCGVLNAVVTLMDGRQIQHKFDKILLDAPCSSSGTIRGLTKNSEFIARSWNLERIKSTAGLQKKLILNAYNLLNKKGVLVYSICSLEPEEGEEVIQFLLDNTDAKTEKIDLKIKSGVNLEFNGKKYSDEIKKCIKLWPQYHDTEGFFIAKIKKN